MGYLGFALLVSSPSPNHIKRPPFVQPTKDLFLLCISNIVIKSKNQSCFPKL